MNISFFGNVPPPSGDLERIRAEAAAEAAAKAAQRGAGDAAYAQAKADPTKTEADANRIATEAANRAYDQTLKNAMAAIPARKTGMLPILLAVGAAWMLTKG